MTPRLRRSRSIVQAKRWATYAAAGAATAVAAPEAANAAVWYSGPVNLSVRAPGSSSTAIVPLQTQSGQTFALGAHVSFFSNLGVALFGAYGNVPDFYAAGWLYASNLPYSTPLNSANFAPAASVWLTMAYVYGYGNDQSLNPGIGYLGFKFDVGNGEKLGYARVDMDGAPYNGYTIIDYLYGDRSDNIRVGILCPEPGSLGLLACGAVGLLAWRRSRRRRNEPAPSHDVAK